MEILNSMIEIGLYAFIKLHKPTINKINAVVINLCLLSGQ